MKESDNDKPKNNHQLEDIKAIFFLIPAGIVVLLTVVFLFYLLADQAASSVVSKWHSVALFFYNIGTPVATFSALLAAYVSFKKYFSEKKEEREIEQEENNYLVLKKLFEREIHELERGEEKIDDIKNRVSE